MEAFQTMVVCLVEQIANKEVSENRKIVEFEAALSLIIYFPINRLRDPSSLEMVFESVNSLMR